MARGGDGAAGDVGEAGHAEVDGGAPPGELVELREFLAGGCEADLQALGLAEPALALGFVDAGLEVVAQARQPGPLGRVGPQQRAPDAALTCPMFVTSAEFLLQHHAQRQATLQIISAAEASGHARVAEMNRQVAGNLDKIITALGSEGNDEKEAAAGAS